MIDFLGTFVLTLAQAWIPAYIWLRVMPECKSKNAEIARKFIVPLTIFLLFWN